jgi:hypothetical protein
MLGGGLYALNMYGFTALFPWFIATRDWITLCAHIVFGASCTLACRWAAARLSHAGPLPIKT